MSDLPIAAEFFPMNAHDVDEVAALEASLQVFPWSRGNFVDALDAGYRLWVLRQGGLLIGFSVVMIVLDEAHLLNIGVDRAHQGRGHGARLLRQVMQLASESGASRMLLEVRPSNVQAVALYRHFGFQQIGVRKGYYPAVVGREDGLVFDRVLP